MHKDYMNDMSGKTVSFRSTGKEAGFVVVLEIGASKGRIKRAVSDGYNKIRIEQRDGKVCEFLVNGMNDVGKAEIKVVKRVYRNNMLIEEETSS